MFEYHLVKCSCSSNFRSFAFESEYFVSYWFTWINLQFEFASFENEIWRIKVKLIPGVSRNDPYDAEKKSLSLGSMDFQVCRRYIKKGTLKNPEY